MNVLHAEEYPSPDFNEMIDTTVRLLEEYNITFESQCRMFVDGENHHSFARSNNGKDNCSISHGPYYYAYWKEKVLNSDTGRAVRRLKKRYIGSYLPEKERS